MRSRGLNKKHLKALELLKTTDLPVLEVAKKAGMSKDHLRDLMTGQEKAGPIAQEFGQEFQKEMEAQDARIAKVQRSLKETVFTKLEAWTREHSITEENRKSFVDISKVLQTGPTYNIGSVSYSKGLTPEEMVNEFKRLRALAESALGRKSVQGAEEGGSGVLSSSSGRGNEAEDGEEDTSVSAKSKARGVSQE